MDLRIEQKEFNLRVTDYYIKIGHPLKRTSRADFVQDVVSLLTK